MAATYTEDNIRSLDWKEHIRKRPGMYIGKLGDGSSSDDGLYILLKEVVDNAIDEHMMGHGKEILVNVNEKDGQIVVRDYGRGIPLGKLYDCAAKMNTGAKYDSEAFQKAVGLNGVGIKAVNALSQYFYIQAWREGETRAIEFSAGEVIAEAPEPSADEQPNGTMIAFRVDTSVFPEHIKVRMDYIERMCRYYTYLNPGLTIKLNGKRYKSKNGLLDLLTEEMADPALYAPIHLKGEDIEIVFTHKQEAAEDYYTFVNGQNTTQGGTHQAAFREAVVKVLRDFYKKQYDPSDIRHGLEAAVAVRIQEPVFESQTKTKLGSTHISPEGETMRTFVLHFLKEKLDNYLHKHTDVADEIQKRILYAEKMRKDLKGIQKVAKERAKQVKLHNKKLRDSKFHYNTKNKRAEETMIFITEGDSASGSITKSRDVETQAVFSLRGKPLNTYGLDRKVIYQNEEFALLQAALGIEDGIENLRYNKVIVATDADVDGMHIRLLLLTFLLQFFPELVRDGHVYILETPLFRIRDKKRTIYCYDEEERKQAMKELNKNPEITRFKGLGEISPNEFGFMIGPDMRTYPVNMEEGKKLRELLTFYMGKNTPDRQEYIIANLRDDVDKAEVE